jgi:hypothetical protein
VENYFGIIAISVSISASFFIETSSWWIKSLYDNKNIGSVVSRTNIYLYGGRIFALLFTTALSYLVDSGFNIAYISFTISVSFIFSSITHILFLNNSILSKKIIIFLASLSRLDKPSVLKISKNYKITNQIPLFSLTILSAVVFSFGLGIPYLTASMFPEYRMMISNMGQILNVAGTLIILFFVDQKLYLEMDSGNLKGIVHIYSSARSVGFFISGLLFLLISECVN